MEGCVKQATNRPAKKRAQVSTETNFFSITDGLTNAERGIATWGDFNGRNQQTGKWFQWFQNGSYPLISNNSGQWLFNPVNQNAGLPTIASTIDIAGNLTIGLDASGNIMAPNNGLYVQGDVIIGNKINVVTGTNASIGSATLINGSVTINTTAVTAESIIMYCVKAISGSVGFLSQGAITPGISFVINSSSSSDNSTINWWIIN